MQGQPVSRIFGKLTLGQQHNDAIHRARLQEVEERAAKHLQHAIAPLTTSVSLNDLFRTEDATARNLGSDDKFVNRGQELDGPAGCVSRIVGTCRKIHPSRTILAERGSIQSASELVKETPLAGRISQLVP